MKQIFSFQALALFMCMTLSGCATNPPDERLAVLQNVARIDTAKERYAREKKLKDGAVVSEADIAPYIKGGFPRHPDGGQYIINVLGKSPESSKYGSLVE